VLQYPLAATGEISFFWQSLVRLLTYL